jgi:hypothetical protein
VKLIATTLPLHQVAPEQIARAFDAIAAGYQQAAALLRGGRATGLAPAMATTGHIQSGGAPPNVTAPKLVSAELLLNALLAGAWLPPIMELMSIVDYLFLSRKTKATRATAPPMIQGRYCFHSDEAGAAAGAGAGAAACCGRKRFLNAPRVLAPFSMVLRRFEPQRDLESF